MIHLPNIVLIILTIGLLVEEVIHVAGVIPIVELVSACTVLIGFLHFIRYRSQDSKPGFAHFLSYRSTDSEYQTWAIFSICIQVFLGFSLGLLGVYGIHRSITGLSFFSCWISMLWTPVMEVRWMIFSKRFIFEQWLKSYDRDWSLDNLHWFLRLRDLPGDMAYLRNKLFRRKVC